MIIIENPYVDYIINLAKKKYIGIFKQKNETKYLLNNINDIFTYSDKIKATVSEYLEREAANLPKRGDSNIESEDDQ